jgi:hypothetical protein
VLHGSLVYPGMRSKADPALDWLAAAVVAHFIVSVVHGAAHVGAHVLLSSAATLYVFVVILAGPLIGLALMRLGQRIGSWVIALALAGSLVFGLAYHFVFANPDHVAHVDPPWRLLFATTAGLLSVTEALGCGLAIHVAQGEKSS